MHMSLPQEIIRYTALMLACMAVFGVNRTLADEAPPEGFTFAAGGDIIGPRGPLTEAFETSFSEIAAHFRNADIGVANLEGAIFDLASFDGFPAAENGGGYPLYPRTLATELGQMGIRLVS
jgi:poly-gamma-glutamate synthesis protein (capsule biosynthesis protein)